ncbi:hypothetical protein ABFS82_12G089600 [Erythranthe guttata]
MQMESIFDTEFPGFLPANIAPRDEFVAARRAPLSRLQRRAPGPLLLKPATSEVKSTGGNNKDSSSSIVDSCFSSKDPIPLLSPLVLPSMLDSPLLRHESSIVSNNSH